ncbi:MAG: hypothetical protein Q9201_003095 [Fulgogasparrea decipioides]
MTLPFNKPRLPPHDGMPGQANLDIVQAREDTKSTINCASCHGLEGALTDPSGWSRAVEDRDIHDAVPITALKTDARLRGRGSAWDNKHGQDERDALGLKATRGTNWDGTHGEDKRDALGPKVGQGGKPQPLYGNDDVDDGKRVLTRGCVNCLLREVKRWVSSPYISLKESGWNHIAGGKPTPL